MFAKLFPESTCSSLKGKNTVQRLFFSPECPVFLYNLPKNLKLRISKVYNGVGVVIVTVSSGNRTFKRVSRLKPISH